MSPYLSAVMVLDMLRVFVESDHWLRNAQLSFVLSLRRTTWDTSLLVILDVFCSRHLVVHVRISNLDFKRFKFPGELKLNLNQIQPELHPS